MKKLKGDQPLTIEDLGRILANPYYCVNFNEGLIGEHPFLVGEEEWVEVNTKVIKQDGDNGKKFLRNLLEVLKGNYI
jgi:hypothetical protein